MAIFEVALAVGATIGESPTWSAAEGALYWIDVKAPSLSRHVLETGRTRTWTFDSDIGGFCLTRQEGAVVALRYGLFHIDLKTDERRLLAPPPFDPRFFRFNEGACDPSGRFWIGEMFDPSVPGAQARPGRLHSFTMEGGLRPEPDAGVLHNGMAWSVDGRRFFLSHSYERSIFCFDYHPDQGRLGERRLFAKVDANDGIPDGAALDVEGCYWTALHGASRVRRYRPSGSIDRDWMLPVSQPTMPTFGGAGLTDLYVTSAAEKTDPIQEPMAGNIFHMSAEIQGASKQIYVV